MLSPHLSLVVHVIQRKREAQMVSWLVLSPRNQGLLIPWAGPTGAPTAALLQLVAKGISSLSVVRGRLGPGVAPPPSSLPCELLHKVFLRRSAHCVPQRPGKCFRGAEKQEQWEAPDAMTPLRQERASGRLRALPQRPCCLPGPPGARPCVSCMPRRAVWAHPGGVGPVPSCPLGLAEHLLCTRHLAESTRAGLGMGGGVSALSLPN